MRGDDEEVDGNKASREHVTVVSRQRGVINTGDGERDMMKKNIYKPHSKIHAVYPAAQAPK
jgi:hypothetical protein